uniref:Uncharacterized protein n=1 Tax=Arundo donax TaxID=35708 RepID=A0A0A9CR59_ARUDO
MLEIKSFWDEGNSYQGSNQKVFGYWFHAVKCICLQFWIKQLFVD